MITKKINLLELKKKGTLIGGRTIYAAAVLAASAGMSISAITPAMAKAPVSYFTYEIKAPGKKAVIQSSRKAFDATKIKAGKSKVKITLKKFYAGGKRIPLSSARISYRFISAGHIVSLTEGGKTISVSSRLFKAAAGTEKAALAVGKKDALSEIVPEASADVKERKYKKSVESAEKLVNVKIGRYGDKNTGFTIMRDGFMINGKKQKKGSYSWWISEYRPRRGAWTATSFVVGQKHDFDAGDSAYRFAVQRKGTAITGMKLTDVLIRTGDSLETWNVQNDADMAWDYGASRPAGWKKDMIFPYAYILSPVRAFKASSEKKGTISVSWSTDMNAGGYVMECSRNSDFSLARTQRYTGWDVSRCAASGLRSGEAYYVRIRSWRNVDGKTYYSPWKILPGTISVM